MYIGCSAMRSNTSTPGGSQINVVPILESHTRMLSGFGWLDAWHIRSRTDDKRERFNAKDKTWEIPTVSPHHKVQLGLLPGAATQAKERPQSCHFRSSPLHGAFPGRSGWLPQCQLRYLRHVLSLKVGGKSSIPALLWFCVSAERD